MKLRLRLAAGLLAAVAAITLSGVSLSAQELETACFPVL
jgi:hypothetical protein